MPLKTLILCILFVSTLMPPAALAQKEYLSTVPDEVLYLQDLKPDHTLDPDRLDPLIDFALNTTVKESDLPDLDGMSGAFFRFRIPTGITEIIDYAYNPEVPAHVFRPSSVRYTQWKDRRINREAASTIRDLARSPKDYPLVVRGLEYEEITPDRFSGAYYGYDQLRTLALFESANATVFISVSRQDEKSKVGHKGAILGEDTDWRYFYSPEKGITKSGLGWADSYMYSGFTVTVYTQRQGEAETTAMCFNWLDAGWMGMNFVKSKHILSGLKRFARDASAVLSHPDLPDAETIAAFHKKLKNCPQEELAALHTEILSTECAESDNDLLQEYCPKIRSGDFSEQVPGKYLRAAIGLLQFKKWLKKSDQGPDPSQTPCLSGSP
ncbi:MAG: hypothetical protein ACLFSY_08020 [Desulfonatronovibrionaceae bacterium]